MNATRLEVLRAEFARAILTEPDENLLLKVIAFFGEEKKARQTPPCQYTLDELHNQIAGSMDDYRTGRIVTMEEMRAKHPRR